MCDSTDFCAPLRLHVFDMFSEWVICFNQICGLYTCVNHSRADENGIVSMFDSFYLVFFYSSMPNWLLSIDNPSLVNISFVDSQTIDDIIGNNNPFGIIAFKHHMFQICTDYVPFV